MIASGHFNIRLGIYDDIYEVGEVFSDSVRELCKNDYEPNTIVHWIASISPESRAKHISNDALWIAEVDGEIAGYLISIPGEVVALFVGSSFSGLGIGIALLKLGIEMARKNGAAEIKLESTITAVQFYKKIGFKEVSRGYYTYEQTGLKLPIINMVLS